MKFPRRSWWQRLTATPAQRAFDAQVDGIADLWDSLTDEEKERAARQIAEASAAAKLSLAEINAAVGVAFGGRIVASDA